VKPIRRLIAERNNCGVHSDNKYVFPYGQQSQDHVVGWHEIRKMCLEAKVAQPHLVTANRVRHRAATIHATADYSEKEKEAFYKHMGHSKDIDAKVYQCPLGVTEVCKVGKYFVDLDSGTLQHGKGILKLHLMLAWMSLLVSDNTLRLNKSKIICTDR